MAGIWHGLKRNRWWMVDSLWHRLCHGSSLAAGEEKLIVIGLAAGSESSVCDVRQTPRMFTRRGERDREEVTVHYYYCLTLAYTLHTFIACIAFSWYWKDRKDSNTRMEEFFNNSPEKHHYESAKLAIFWQTYINVFLRIWYKFFPGFNKIVITIFNNVFQRNLL